MDHQKELSSGIKKYYLFQFFYNLSFFQPIIVLFWQSNGLNLTQMMFLQSIYSIGVLALELPTGVFADRFGKRLSLMLGTLFFCTGSIWYGLSHNYWQFIIGELVAGAGMAFISGADKAYIHQLLKSKNREGEYQKIEGRARGVIQIAWGVASIAGGVIATVFLGLPLIIAGFAALVSFFAAATFPKTRIDLPREEKTEYFSLIRDSVKLVRNHKELLWLTLFFAFFNALIWPLHIFAQVYLKFLNVPVYFFGVIFMGFNLVSALATSFSHKFERITKNYSFLVMSASIVFSLFLLGTFPSLYIFPLWVIFLTSGLISQTIISSHVLKIIPNEKAATILSFQSLLRRVIYAIIGPILGFATDIFGIKTSLIGYGLLALIILSVLLLNRKYSI